ncbi:hypothetical protein BGW36DRAFT_364677 [Talaromyces proteolyticus]|uniref:Uncharacterized protein n=1 Tax=Talaromyces proteolyticus TaxID=1131652 RepID=A0AAD4KJH2_9EURO|nr:uncharacterized protein BGW36DRAFT_364677 [Talaromyces proteolyticus]KAH8689941.1 hypothetical protein BGW36DRAFT_364677 [Talaromyces proteolyticus]
MGIFGRKHGNSATAISQPVLTFTDAAPRDDLRGLWDIESPKQGMAERGKPHTEITMQEFQDAVQAFDFTVTEPPDGLVTGHSANGTMDGSMIGIALGSPSMLPPPPQFQPIEWKTPTIDVSSERTEPPGSLRRKPSKWKKFGDLFKGKQGETRQTYEPFYQLDRNNQPYHPESQMQFPSSDNGTANINPIPTPDKSIIKGQDAKDDSLLQIDIPTVHMERYSVMFSSVLGQKPSSSLLARRSKALNQIQVHHRKNNNFIEPPIPQRRATSPGPAKSPAFLLFPNNENGPSANPLDATAPLELKSPRRSNTFPAETPRTQTKNTHLTVPDLTPALSSGTSLGYASTEVSSAGIDSPSEIISKPTYIPGPEPVWEMITKRSDSPLSITISAHVSTHSTPATSREDLVSTKANQLPRENPLFPPRVSSRDHDLPIGQPKPRARSQTMPTPLKINKKTVSIEQQPKQKPPQRQEQQKFAISTARSVSVTGRRPPKQSSASLAPPPSSSLPPGPATRDRFQFEPTNKDERFGEHQKLVPTVVDIRRGSGHQHKKSENVVIETL